MTQEKLPHRKELCLQSEGAMLYASLLFTYKRETGIEPVKQFSI